MWNRTRQKIFSWILKRKLKHIDTQHQFVAWQSVKKVAVLMGTSSQKDIDFAFQWLGKLKDNRLEMNIIVFDLSEKSTLQLPKDVLHFSPNDTNWFYFPKSSFKKIILENQFDWLINLHVEECLPLTYISALSSATFRVGHYKKNEEYYCDFMIKTEKSDNFEQYLEKLFYYIFKIK